MENVKTSYDTRFLGGLPLRVVEVGGDGDDGSKGDESTLNIEGANQTRREKKAWNMETSVLRIYLFHQQLSNSLD